jgi:hypothetical protein
MKSPSLYLGRKLPIFRSPCLFLEAAFPFSLTNPTLYADLAVSQVNLLPHEPILWPVEARTLDTGPQQYKGVGGPKVTLVLYLSFGLTDSTLRPLHYDAV